MRTGQVGTRASLVGVLLVAAGLLAACGTNSTRTPGPPTAPATTNTTAATTALPTTTTTAPTTTTTVSTKTTTTYCPTPRTSNGHPGPAVPARCFPSPASTAMAHLSSRTQVPLQAPSILPAGLSATASGSTGAAQRFNCPTTAAGRACPASLAVASYTVSLYDCGAYPLNAPALGSSACEQQFGSFGGSQYTDAATAQAALVSSADEPRCTPVLSTRKTYLGYGITGVLTTTGPAKYTSLCSLSWTEGDWTIALQAGSSTAAQLVSVATPLVAYFHSYLLPETTGDLTVYAGQGNNGYSATAYWVLGNDVYTVMDPTSALGTAKLVVSMRSAGA